MSLDLRRSTSRRSTKLSSPPPRSRSTERFQSESSINKVIGSEEEDHKDDGDDGVWAEQPEVRKGHVRAISDPFDTQVDQLFDSKDVVAPDVLEEEQLHEPSRRRTSSLGVVALPTLPRFPVIEARNKNCWSEPPVSIFQVRGANYGTAKKKIASGPYLLRARGCDVFLANQQSPELEDK